MSMCVLFFGALVSAANWAAMGIMYNSGQDCTAGSRLYVQDTIFEKFMNLLTTKAKQQIVGDGFDENASGGPVASFDPLYDPELRLTPAFH